MTTAMFQYDFMVNAFVAAGIVAVVSGIVGFFLVMRGQTFAGHALSHIGFAGATGAGLIGLAPIWGLIGFTLGAGIGMGMLGERITGRDVAIGVVLTLALGFGLLFLHYYTSFATQATAILFGNVLAVDRSTIAILAGLAVVTLVALAAIMRPLVFATLQPELAEAKSVPLRFVSTAFLAVVALAVSECAQIVGVLLVFTLMVGPPAAAQAVTTGLWTGLTLSAALALGEAWLGITLAYYTDWPVSFCIALLSAVAYFGSIATPRRRNGSKIEPIPEQGRIGLARPSFLRDDCKHRPLFRRRVVGRDRLLLGRLNGPMVVAMIAVRMMQPSVHEVIDVVAVRDGFVTAPRAVRMPRTSHVRRALRRVCLADRQHMLIDVVDMHVVQVAVVQIVDVSIVADRGMPAIRFMLVMVIGVVRFVAGGHGFLLHGLTTFVRIGHRRSVACLIALCTRSRTWASATA